MKVDIKSRYNDAIIYSGEGETLAAVVIKAVAVGANLRGANLYGANLRGANLGGANLCGADLGEDRKPYAQYRTCAEGTITGWKRLACGNVLRLEIPADAKRCNAIGSRKCRAEYAIACAVYDTKGELIEPITAPLRSKHNNEFTYELGKEVRPDKYDDDIRVECSSGIHFFITFEEAAEYV